MRPTLPGALLTTLVFAAACSGSVASEQFCVMAQANSGRVDESYVGSEEHVAALNELVAAAPNKDIADELATIRNYIRDGVAADDPDSKHIANYPADVQQAVKVSEEFIASECDVDMAP